MVDRQRLTISHSNLLRPFILRLIGETVEISSEVIKSSRISKPWILIAGNHYIGCTCHGSKLGRRIFALIVKVHPMVTIQCSMSRFSTNLTAWAFMLEALKGVL